MGAIERPTYRVLAAHANTHHRALTTLLPASSGRIEVQSRTVRSSRAVAQRKAASEATGPVSDKRTAGIGLNSCSFRPDLCKPMPSSCFPSRVRVVSTERAAVTGRRPGLGYSWRVAFCPVALGSRAERIVVAGVGRPRVRQTGFSCRRVRPAAATGDRESTIAPLGRSPLAATPDSPFYSFGRTADAH